jgi:hypothetical protein
MKAKTRAFASAYGSGAKEFTEALVGHWSSP